MPTHHTIAGFGTTARLVRQAARARDIENPDIFSLGDEYGWDRWDTHNLTHPLALKLYLMVADSVPDGYQRIARIMCQSVATNIGGSDEEFSSP